MKTISRAGAMFLVALALTLPTACFILDSAATRAVYPHRPDGAPGCESWRVLESIDWTRKLILAI